MRPSCGTRRSAMLSELMILKREARAGPRLLLLRRLHDLLELAVNPVAHAELVLEALEVDVARAALHGVREKRVDELHDRRVVHRRREGGRRHLLFLVLHDLEGLVAAPALQVLEERRN